MKVRRALVSVSNKEGLEGLVKALDRMGVEMISTGGTAKAIKALGIKVVDIDSYTGFPEMLDGRVKTLHPKIHAGLLAIRDNAAHAGKMKEMGIPYIDMVVVNLYPFEATVARPGVTLEEAIENIDIGGPSMLRSAAKNYRSVAVVSSPSQYADVLGEMERSSGEISADTLKKLALEVFRRTSSYDGTIFSYLSGATAGETDGFKQTASINIEKIADLRYGENPHQKAAFYKDLSSRERGLDSLEKLQGKELSFNNIVDLGAAYEVIRNFDRPAASVVKHNNPCGAATGDTLEAAYVDALDSDRTSAFGGIMAFNKVIGPKMAELILKEADFVECLIAPGYESGALEIFKAKPNLRVVKMPFSKSSRGVDMKEVPGGFLLQDKDVKRISKDGLKVVTLETPPVELVEPLLFGWEIVRHVKSNAIVLANGTKTVGIGAGQMSRVDSVMIAIRKAGERARGAVLASDAFFPMPDSIEEAHKAGIAAIIQPGGSIRDKDVIAACDKYSIPMVFTAVRHFKH
jgi:phosphoribosylaminoimidazolecarboxamide formyltransferase/IMP cyclohydrolase